MVKRMNTLEKKYGPVTATAMVVGVVIGSGVFFKADDVLNMTKGNILLALIAWVIGAFAMIFGALVFAEYAQRIEKNNGIVDYTEVAYGRRAGYLVGWFNWILYFSPLTAILAWVTGQYLLTVFSVSSAEHPMAVWWIAAALILAVYLINSVAPAFSGKLQVGVTVAKLIPLILVGIVGTFVGIKNGVSVSNFTAASTGILRDSHTLSSAVVATAFAYEGWIVALTINGEIKDAKKNLPRALTFGALIIFIIYIAYFLGVSGVLPTERIMAEGDQAVLSAVTTLFGTVAGTVLMIFVTISCFGTLNGLILTNIRVPYSLAVRGLGPIPGQLSKIEKRTGMPLRAALLSTVLSLFYLFLWYGSLNQLFGRYIGIDEIPIVMVYGVYVFLYIWYMKHFDDLNLFSRFVKPGLAMVGSAIILYGGFSNESIGMYLLISVAVLLFGLVFYREEKTESHVNKVI
jgi:APA family basic amino acid/polyamine antiporter